MGLDISLEEMQLCPVFESSTTHNLVPMASEAGLYQCLWHPDDNGITKASQLTPLLKEGLLLLKSNPEHFKRLNPSNGWGTYDIFVDFVQECLRACLDHPEAIIKSSI